MFRNREQSFEFVLKTVSSGMAVLESEYRFKIDVKNEMRADAVTTLSLPKLTAIRY